MVTKSKNIKRYPLWIKALCVLLSAACVAAAAFVGVYGLLVYKYIYKPSGYTWKLTDPVPSVYRSVGLRDQLNENIHDIYTLTRSPAEQAFLLRYESQKEALCEQEVQRYLSEKAAIIRNEVYYVATHYDTIETPDYYYEAYNRDFNSTPTTTTTTASDTQTTHRIEDAATTDVSRQEDVSLPAETSEPETFHVDTHAPYNVMYCQKLLNTVTGLGWLQYMSVVRTEAFTEQLFHPRFSENDDFAYLFDEPGSALDYLSDENTARIKLADAFDEYLSAAKRNHNDSANHAEDHLQKNRNSMQYMLRTADNTVYSNTDRQNQTDAFFRGHKNYIVCQNGKTEVNPDGDWATEQLPEALEAFRQTPETTLYVCLSDTIRGGKDDYSNIVSTYTEIFERYPPSGMLAAGIAAVTLLILLSIAVLVFCGHKAGADGITLAWIDRLPTDVHLLLSCILLISAASASFAVLLALPEPDVSYWFLFSRLVPVLAAALWLIVLEWLTSTVRIKKSGASYFRRFVLWKLLRWLWQRISKLFGKIKKAVLYVLEKPKKIRYVFLLSTVLFFAAAVIWTLLTVAGWHQYMLCVCGFSVLTALYVLFQIRYLRTLDTIIDRSCDRSCLPIPDTDAMPPALRTLADNLSVTSAELDKAVAQAVRDARTKAELITNVSHDLKTPLTSIVSYVDLLKQCDVADENAKNYLNILEDKSANLKRLIEDLIEASKVSTGNVELHCTQLNLAELATQAVVEATPELEERGLEIRFAETQDTPIIYADGAKMHRILENLLSNVQKYSADHSRVYICIGETDKFGFLEIKNVSREPLDVDPQELMERFVRGDASRSQEGNGLGLSIAQQLCVLQSGRLDIQIDGDLFKATVFLPKAVSAAAAQ